MFYRHEDDILIKSEDMQSLTFGESGVEIEAAGFTPVPPTIRRNQTKNKIPKKCISNKKATILIWEDGTKTIVKCAEEDKYDREKAFLIAYFQKVCGLSKTKANKYLEKIGGQAV